MTRINAFVHFLWLFVFLRQVEEHPRHRFVRIVQVIRRVRYALLFALLSLGIGMLGFILIENYPILDAWYMSVITLATVGFTEVHPLGPMGRLFTSFLILFNVSLFAYAISTVTNLFAEGGFSKLIKEFRMYRRIEALKGHTIICGFGRHAMEVCQELTKQGMSFVIIEKNPEKIEHMREDTPYLYIEGDATEDKILDEAGIKRAASLITTLPDDADNLFIVLSARQTNPNLSIVSRANNESDERKIRRAGANHTVVPERIGGFYMATLVNKPDLVEFFTLLSNMGPSNVVFEEIPVIQLRSSILNTSLLSSGLVQGTPVSVVALRKPDGQYVLNPTSETRLQAGWDLVILGNKEQVQAFKKQFLSV